MGPRMGVGAGGLDALRIAMSEGPRGTPGGG
jgi:hypothetical protein